MAKKAKKKSHSKHQLKWQAAPLKGSFMITSILGIFISIYWVFPQSIQYGIAFIIVFTAMFIASLISMSKAPVINEKY
tara:strand:- start:100 stop:333 length:234 start_codon:yes stop_codon:yes gene_type:complete